MALNSIRCANTSSATTSDPSTGAPPPGAQTWWCGHGGPSATVGGSSSSTPTARAPGGGPRLDWSMDAALLLAALAARAGDHVDFIAHDRVTRSGVYNASRTDLLAQLVDAMAPLQPALVESDARAMVAAVQRRIRRRALVVLLTDLNASALEEGLLAVLPQLSAKHQEMLAEVAEPRVENLAARRADAAQ